MKTKKAVRRLVGFSTAFKSSACREANLLKAQSSVCHGKALIGIQVEGIIVTYWACAQSSWTVRQSVGSAVQRWIWKEPLYLGFCCARLQRILLWEFLTSGKCAHTLGRQGTEMGWEWLPSSHWPQGTECYKFHLFCPHWSALTLSRSLRSSPQPAGRGGKEQHLFCSWNFLHKIFRTARN